MLALIRTKGQGKEVAVPRPREAEGAEVVDLADALRRSLAARTKRTRTSTATKRPA